MIHALLRRGDGTAGGRSSLRPLVKPVQRALADAGFALTPDGQFGPGTERALRAFQAAAGVPESGVTDRATWGALEPHVRAACAPQLALLAELMPTFHGETGWVHEQEGHVGRPYWAKGESGVTLDPGVDLGYVDRDLFARLYTPLVSAEQLRALEGVLGLKGDAAERALAADRVLQGVRITADQADAIMPSAAQPYWDAIARRFGALAADACPGSVQTVLLSLAYNRGANNRDLEQLRASLDAGDWDGTADRVAAMQQDHPLEGIRVRRRREAELIRVEIEYLRS